SRHRSAGARRDENGLFGVDFLYTRRFNWGWPPRGQNKQIASGRRRYSPDAYSHLDARAKPVNDGHKPVNGETPEIRIADTRKVSCRDAGAVMRRAYRQPFPVERLDDLRRKNRLEVFGVRGRMSYIAEYIADSAQ